MDLQQKHRELQENLRRMRRVAVAYSGGVDSTLLLRVAHDVLGDNAIAITAKVGALPARDLEQACSFCAENGIRQLLVDVDMLAIPGVRQNPPDRCYLCKRGIFTALLAAAPEGFAVVDGSNTDDQHDYRPGSRAIRELQVASPLLQAGLSKAEIRQLSQQLGLPTWDKPSAACLASRFAYGEEITPQGLARVDAAEAFLQERGLRTVRVRVHGTLARIEVAPDVIALLAQEPLRSETCSHLKELGFSYVTVDLAGYRMGSMNEVLPETGR